MSRMMIEYVTPSTVYDMMASARTLKSAPYTWRDAARTYGVQADLARAGRIWSGDPERAKATRWIALYFQRMSRLAQAMDERFTPKKLG